MRRALLFILALALLAGGAAMTGSLRGGISLAEEDRKAHPVEGGPIELADGAGNPIAELWVRQYRSEEPGEIAVVYALTNTADLSLTRITFSVDYRDAEGRSLREEPLEMLVGMAADPLLPGETREFTRQHWFQGAETAVAFALMPVLAETELDVMPWTQPQPGNLLLDFCNYPPFTAHFEDLDINPPVSMHFHVDQSVDEDITDPETILAEIESLKRMRIGEERDIFITDSGISYRFTMADGSEWGVSFEAPGLFHWHGKNYEILAD